MRLGRRLCYVYWKIWFRISLEWIVHLWWSNLPRSAGALKGEQVGLEMTFFLYRITTLLGSFHWKPKNFAFVFEYKGGIAGPHCCLHAHHVLCPSVSFHHHAEHCKWYQMICFWDFWTKHSSYKSLLKHPETEDQRNGLVLCFVCDRGGKDPTDEVGAVELGLGNPCRWHRHRCSVEHPGAVMTSEVEWKLWSMSLRLTKGFRSFLSPTSFAEQSFFVLFCLLLDWKRSQGCFQDGSSSELPEFGGPTCRRFHDGDFMPCAARTFHDTCRRTTPLGLGLMVGNFRNPLCDLSCGKIHDRFKNWFSVNLCALNLLSLQILLFESLLRSCWCFLLHFSEMLFTFQVS